MSDLTRGPRGSKRRCGRRSEARFWVWIVALVLTCLFLGAVLASAAGARGGLAAWTVGDPLTRTAVSGVPANPARTADVAGSKLVAAR
jgi:hypothetical protein